MPSINKIVLLGHIGQEPKTYTTSGGKIYTKFVIATQDNQAGKTAETAWHDCTAWGEIAGKILSNCKKGDLVYVEGKMIYGKYKEQKTFNIFTNQVIPLRHAYKKGAPNAGQEATEKKNICRKHV